MSIEKKLKICFMGGRQAGIIGALTALARGDKILAAVSYSDDLTIMLKTLKIPLYKKVSEEGLIDALKRSDLLLSVHGREIVKDNLLQLPKYGGINLHPYLYKYKGADPVGRALADKEFKASVGAHVMESRVDEGEVLVEEFLDITGIDNVEAVFNRLYPHYASVTLKVLEKISDKKYKR